MSLYINGTGGALGKILAAFFQTMRPKILSSKKGVGDFFCDLADLSSCQNFNIEGDDILVFLGAVSKPDFCAVNNALARRINVENTTVLVRRFLDSGARVLFFSSDAVYGDQDGILSEEDSLKGKEPYGLMKMEVENTFMSEPRFKALRLSYVVHGEDGFTRYLRQTMCSKGVASIFSGYARNMVCIDDVIAAVDKAIRNWEMLPKTLNLGGPECLSRIQAAVFYKNGPFSALDYSEEEPPESFFRVRPRRIALDVGKLHRFLGREPRRIEDWLADQRENPSFIAESKQT